MVLQTERLFLRAWQQEDFADLAEMLQDPQVMYAYEHDFSDADVQEWMERQWRRYREHGFGLWAMVEKQSGEIVGQAGLTIQQCEGQDVLEIGYHLKKKQKAACSMPSRFWMHRRFTASSRVIIWLRRGWRSAWA